MNATPMNNLSAEHENAPTANTHVPLPGQTAADATSRVGPENVNRSSSDLGHAPLSRPESDIDKFTGHAVAEDIPPVKKRTRITKEQRNAILHIIAKEHTDGLPVQAIMHRHGLSSTQVEHFQVELFRKGLIIQRNSAFEVIKVTDTVKSLLALKEPWAWLKVEKSSDGRSYVLTEYTGA